MSKTTTLLLLIFCCCIQLQATNGTSLTSISIDSCPADIKLAATPGQNGLNVSWQEPSASTSCLITTPPNCDAIPDQINGYIYMGAYNGSKYYCSETNSFTWSQANYQAQLSGGHLVAIGSSDENQYLKSKILADAIWLGFTDQNQEGQFVWSNNESISYTNWASGEPNDQDPYYTGADHAVLLKENGLWKDRNGSHNQYEFVMEKTCPSSSQNGTLTIVQTEGPANGDFFPIGTTKVSYLITDDCNDSQICSFMVTVDGPIDPCVNNGGDTDGDGICDNQDNCVDTYNPDQADTDNDGTGDVCDTAGPDCNSITINAGAGTINISGLGIAPISSVQIFNDQWQEKYSCFADCNATEEINLINGTYYVYVKYYTATYGLICQTEKTVEVTGGSNPCDNDGGDTDGDGICDNQDNCVNTYNPDQADADNDGEGDACDHAADCDQIQINTTDGTLTVSGLGGAPISSLQIFTTTWQQEYQCFATCNATETINLPSGSYIVYVKYYTASYALICEVEKTIEITGGVDPCANDGGDTDGDGICDNQDNCIFINNPDQADADGNGIGDACEPVDPCANNGGDTDGDGVCDNQDNCVDTYNPGQADSDGNGIGDLCDAQGICASVTSIKRVQNLSSACSGAADRVIWMDGAYCKEIGDLYFIEFNDGTAKLKGRVQEVNGGNISQVDVTFTGKTNSGTPFTDCASTTQSASWYYYSDFYGTIGGYQVAPNPAHNFQVGFGANVKNNSYGASGWFTLDGIATDFNFDLSDPLPCSDNNNNDIIDLCENGSTDPCDGQGGDSDNDGICDAQDNCIDTYNPDQADSNGNGIGDLCDTPDPDCGQVAITSGTGTITVNGLDGADVTAMQIFNDSWQSEYQCFANCNTEETINLTNGTYHVYVKYYTAAYTLICETNKTIEVTGGSDPCEQSGGDSDNDGICDDQDNCPDTYNPKQEDRDGNGLGDICDTSGSDCGKVTLAIDQGTLTVSGLNGAPISSLQIFDNTWREAFKCFGDCDDVELVNLTNGVYEVYIKFYTNAYGVICQRAEKIVIDNALDPCANNGGDTDRDGICDDQDNCKYTFNANQADSDGDGIGDVCDAAICNDIVSIRQVQNLSSACSGADDRILWVEGAYCREIGDLYFIEYADGTATLKGRIQEVDGSVISEVDVTFTGKANGGTPYEDCASLDQVADWYYYADFSGTIGGYQVVPNPDHNFQVGFGANVKNETYGASGWMHLGSQKADFNFDLSDPITCSDDNDNGIIDVVENYNGGILRRGDVFVFDATKGAQSVDLIWTINTDFKTASYEIERSTDGVSFDVIEETNSDSDHFQAVIYELNDRQPAMGINAYRVKQIFKDGSFRYSAIEEVEFEVSPDRLTVFPNPATDILHIGLKEYAGLPATIQIYNSLGILLQEKIVDQLQLNPVSLELGNYTAGMYTISLKVDGRKQISKLFVIGRK